MPRARRSAAGTRGAPPCAADLVLTVPSDTAFLSVVREVTRRIGAHAGFPAATADRLALAVDECTTNVIRHAYHGQPGKAIELRFCPDGNAFRVEVLDEGDAIDRRKLPKVDLERYAAEHRTGGLGVHLMGKLMDSVTYCRRSGRNVCRMVKRGPGAGRARG